MTATEPHQPKFDAQGRRLPDFFIAGHSKCGTTALYEMLRTHPQIYMPDVKEPRFLATDVYKRPKPGSGPLPGDLDEYLALFAPARADQVTGEASPLYLLSHTAAREISELNADARIIVILREPASFLRSLHMQFVESHLETRNDLLRAVELDDERRQGREVPTMVEFVPQVLVYSDHVRYAEQLARYREHFADDRLLVMIYDDFRTDNRRFVRRVLDFLDVDDTTQPEPLEANPTIRVRSVPLHQMVHSVSVGRGGASRAVKGAVKAVTPRSLRRRALMATQHKLISAKPQAADDEVMLELRRRFAGEVEGLSDYLGRDLVHEWGYDRLG